MAHTVVAVAVAASSDPGAKAEGQPAAVSAEPAVAGAEQEAAYPQGLAENESLGIPGMRVTDGSVGVAAATDIVGLTVAEFIPRDVLALQGLLDGLPLIGD